MRANETGSALLATVLTGVLVSALAGALVAIVTVEEAVEANHRRAVQALYAADGLLASVIVDLAGGSDWDAVLEGSGSARFRAGPVSVSLPDGSVVDAEAEARAGSGNMKRTPHHLARPSLSLGACLPRARSTAAVNPRLVQ